MQVGIVRELSVFSFGRLMAAWNCTPTVYSQSMPQVVVEPVIRWAGSKRKLLPQLARYWRPEFKRYVEPFAGSACLFFRLHPECAVLGDINQELMLTYRQMKANVGAVITELAGLRKGKRIYLRLRRTDPNSLPPAARAARFLYLNRFCFNGLYRTNEAGQFNVPYSGRRCGNLPEPVELRAVARRLRRVTLVASDFEDVLRRVGPGDFVYMDPPFRVNGRRMFTQYDSTAFKHTDLFRLRRWMEALAKQRIPFLVSYAGSEEAQFLSDGFNTENLKVRRNIAGFTERRVLFDEVLISNITPGEDVSC